MLHLLSGPINSVLVGIDLYRQTQERLLNTNGNTVDNIIKKDILENPQKIQKNENVTQLDILTLYLYKEYTRIDYAPRNKNRYCSKACCYFWFCKNSCRGIG